MDDPSTIIALSKTYCTYLYWRLNRIHDECILELGDEEKYNLEMSLNLWIAGIIEKKNRGLF